MSNNLELDEDDLNKIGITDKYDDELSAYNTISWKDYALLYAIGFMVVVFIVWANIATVDELARGMGKIIPSSKVQLIQNLEGGIIDNIFVKEGDIVKEGQPLLKISNIQANVEYKAKFQRVLELKAAIIRLNAVVKGEVPKFSDELRAKAPDIVALEESNYRANLKKTNDELQGLKRQLDQKKQEVNEISEQLRGAKKILKLTREQSDIIRPLVKKGTVSKIELLQLKTKIAGMEASFNNLKASLIKVDSIKQESEERIQAYESTIRANAQKEISDKTSEFNSLNEVLSAYKDRSKRTKILSPVYGTVKEIKITTIGGVVQPGEAIMELVPLDDQLIIEANISPSDVAFLHAGQNAIVKLTAYDYQVYGYIKATLNEISADTFQDNRGESFYRIKLQSKEVALHHNGESLPIIPGMIASVDILTGKKTIMDYLMSRITKTLNSSLHER